MSGDIRAFIEEQRRQILQEKQRLGCLNQFPIQQEESEKLEESLRSTRAAAADENKENQVTKVEKPKKNWVACKSAEKSLKKLEVNREEKFTRENERNEVTKCADKHTRTRFNDTSKNAKDINALEKENDVNFCNRTLDKLKRQNVCNSNEKNKELTDKGTIKSIDSGNNVLKTNKVLSNKQDKDSKKQLSVIDKDRELNNESELKLDLKELTEDNYSDRSSEDKENSSTAFEKKALEKENDVNFCNITLDKLKRQNVCNRNEKNKELTNKGTIKSIDSDNNVLITNKVLSNKQGKDSKKQLSVIDKDRELNNKSELKLDLKELTEDNYSDCSSEDKENSSTAFEKEALGKENDVNFCNRTLDKLKRQNVCNNNERNKELTDKGTIKSIDSDNNVLKTNKVLSNKQDKDSKKQLSVIDKDGELNNKTEIKLDLKELTEDNYSDRSSEDKENSSTAFKKNRCIDSIIGKGIASDPGLVGFEAGLFGAKSDASFGLHARSGPLPPSEAGGAPMDHAYPLLPRPILRRGEYSYGYANRYQQRTSGSGGDALRRAEPHCGVGEYELSRALFAEKRRRDYLRHLAKQNETQSKPKPQEDTIKITQSETNLLEKILESPSRGSEFLKLPEKDSNINADSSKSVKSVQTEFVIDKSLESQSSKSDKSVQTDIQNIHSELVVHYDLRFGKDSSIKEYSPRTITDDLVDLAYGKRPYRRIDQRLTSAENELLLTGLGASSSDNVSKTRKMDKPKSILSNRRTGSPRNRYGPSNSYNDYEPDYSPSNFLDGFSYSDHNEDLERERLKRENYQHELRVQIEEKRRLQDMRAEQERRERELENKRLEQQILRIREEAAMEDSRMTRGNDLNEKESKRIPKKLSERELEKEHTDKVKHEQQNVARNHNKKINAKMRRHSDDLMRRKHELQLERRSWRRHADSESGALDSLGLGTSPALSSHYSPPISRRVPYSLNVPSTSVFAETSSRYNPNRFDSASYSNILRSRDTSLNRMDSLNSYDTNTIPFSHRSRKFDRFDSLSRIDSLSHRLDSMSVRDEGYASTSARLTDVDRRHSATQQDLSLSSRRSPRSRRRNSSSRFDDSLPIPVLKARSPVAKELKNSIPFSSARSISTSDVLRRLEDRWQIPAVQKNILHTTSVSQPESPSGHHSRGSILTQLGSIRSQLQREQLRMDESLRRRGLVRARSTDYGGY